MAKDKTQPQASVPSLVRPEKISLQREEDKDFTFTDGLSMFGRAVENIARPFVSAAYEATGMKSENSNLVKRETSRQEQAAAEAEYQRKLALENLSRQHDFELQKIRDDAAASRAVKSDERRADLLDKQFQNSLKLEEVRFKNESKKVGVQEESELKKQIFGLVGDFALQDRKHNHDVQLEVLGGKAKSGLTSESISKALERIQDLRDLGTSEENLPTIQDLTAIDLGSAIKSQAGSLLQGISSGSLTSDASSYQKLKQVVEAVDELSNAKVSPLALLKSLDSISSLAEKATVDIKKTPTAEESFKSISVPLNENGDVAVRTADSWKLLSPSGMNIARQADAMNIQAQAQIEKQMLERQRMEAEASQPERDSIRQAIQRGTELLREANIEATQNISPDQQSSYRRWAGENEAIVAETREEVTKIFPTKEWMKLSPLQKGDILKTQLEHKFLMHTNMPPAEETITSIQNQVEEGRDEDLLNRVDGRIKRIQESRAIEAFRQRFPDKKEFTTDQIRDYLNTDEGKNSGFDFGKVEYEFKDSATEDAYLEEAESINEKRNLRYMQGQADIVLKQVKSHAKSGDLRMVSRSFPNAFSSSGQEERGWNTALMKVNLGWPSGLWDYLEARPNHPLSRLINDPSTKTLPFLDNRLMMITRDDQSGDGSAIINALFGKSPADEGSWDSVPTGGPPVRLRQADTDDSAYQHVNRVNAESSSVYSDPNLPEEMFKNEHRVLESYHVQISDAMSQMYRDGGQTTEMQSAVKRYQVALGNKTKVDARFVTAASIAPAIDPFIVGMADRAGISDPLAYAILQTARAHEQNATGTFWGTLDRSIKRNLLNDPSRPVQFIPHKRSSEEGMKAIQSLPVGTPYVDLSGIVRKRSPSDEVSKPVEDGSVTLRGQFGL